jgi:hypothetical protein
MLCSIRGKISINPIVFIFPFILLSKFTPTNPAKIVEIIKQVSGREKEVDMNLSLLIRIFIIQKNNDRNIPTCSILIDHAEDKQKR